ncbi:MAG TPA: hypothetical protein VFW94_22570 [Candidatus Acidoferrales bacterium]|nr:hypothetical protein [Candidatus Acidoferrales bacterium]
MQPVTDKRAAAARAFVRSLNILLKFAKMYDFGHPRTARQYETAWTELRTAIGDGDAGLLLAVSGDQLLVDGSPLEAAAAEKSFARMLSSAGIASIYFGAKVNQASLAKFVRAFPTGTSSKPAQLAEQLKSALHGDRNIHVNEVCFVPADSAVAKTAVAAQLAARTLGLTSQQQDEMLNDPEKLLKLIVAAEGMKSGNTPGNEPGHGPGLGPGDGSGVGGGAGSGFGNGPGFEFNTAPGGGTGYQSPYSGAAEQIESRSDNPWRISRPSAGTGSGRGAGTSSGNGSVGGAATVVPGSSGGEKSRGEQAVRGRSGVTQNSSSTAGWNIVGSGDDAGLQTEIDANAGGFWLKNSFASPSSRKGTGSGPMAENAVLAGLAAAIARTTEADSRDVGLPGQPGGSSSPSRWANATSALRSSRGGRKQHDSMTLETGLMALSGDELQGILQMLAQIARTSGEGQIDASAFQSRLSHLSRRARFTVSQALSALAAQAPSQSTDKPTLLKLAEHIAVRFAIENYERGDIKVNAVQQLLGEMNQEIDALRKVVGAYEEKIAEAGIEVPTHQDALAEQFWAQVPDEKKRAVLNSDDAWCIPPVRIREFVEGLRSRGEIEAADQILNRYVACITNRSVDVRRHVAMGLAELAVVYAGNEKLLTEAIRLTGVQVVEETEAELQSLVSAAFVRLSQEAARKRSYPGLQRSIELVGYIEGERPNIGQSLRPRIGVESRLSEFVDEALRSREMPSGLRDLLRRVPDPASEQIASRFSRAGLREDCDLLLSMLEALGPEALDHLRTVLREGPTSDAIDTVGVLARLDPETLVQFLPVRMRGWKRAAHDRVVRQIAGSGSAERGRLLLEIFDEMDELIRPLAVDEIGMTGEQTANMRLLRLAEEPAARGQSGYLRLKAIEALGRLRTMAAEATLRKIAEARKAFRWAHPSELRLVAAQAMQKIDPDWVRDFVPRSGLSTAEFSIEPLDPDPNSSAIRQRRYPRLRLEYPVAASTTGLKENCQIEIPELTLGGGVAVCEQSLHPGSLVGLRLSAEQKNIKAQTIVRDANTQARAFELVDIDLEDRAKLRKLLVQLGNATKQATPNDRNRRSTRTILSNQS